MTRNNYDTKQKARSPRESENAAGAQLVKII